MENCVNLSKKKNQQVFVISSVINGREDVTLR